jgi:uncharacterized protein with HEPN domain
MSDVRKREWCFYLDDMIEFSEKVLAYTSGLDQTGFVANGLDHEATLRTLCWCQELFWRMVPSRYA